MQRFGLNTGPYLAEAMKVKDRLDAHLAGRGPWQRAMFAEYYDRFSLAKVCLARDMQSVELYLSLFTI